MEQVEIDSESGACVYQLTDDRRPVDNIYGEQPYSSPQGSRIAVRFYAEGDRDGGLSILDLEDGSLHAVLEQMPRFPAFHAWGEYLYYQEAVGDELLLKRCHYQSLEKDDVVLLPTEEGRFSYGTVSPDGRWYATSVHREDKSCQVLLVDVGDGRVRSLVDTHEWHLKHEQFSRNGANHILIQANSPDVSQVHLGVLAVDRTGIEWLPVDRPHTPRPTGHEAWIGSSGRVLLSTGHEEGSPANIWTAGLDAPTPAPACECGVRFGHISASSCGRFWIADATGEQGVPIYVGSLQSGRSRRLVDSGTTHDGQQWSHTHPYLTADNGWLIYTSNRSGNPQVYGARVSEELMADLLN